MIGLYFGGQVFKTSFGNDIGNVELDANLDESHDWSAEATQNPVEEGSPVTDHVIEQADTLKISGFVSETPLTASANSRGASNVPWSESITQPVFDLLRDLIKGRKAVTVYTKYRIYPDMILTSLSIPRTAATGDAIEFSAEFVNIRTVATQTVDVPKGISAKKKSKANVATGNKTEPKKDAGKVQAKPEEKQTSQAQRAFAAIKDLTK